MSNTTTRIAKNTLALYFRQILTMLAGLYTLRVALAAGFPMPKALRDKFTLRRIHPAENHNLRRQFPGPRRAGNDCGEKDRGEG
jgi:hypothetical protein